MSLTRISVKSMKDGVLRSVGINNIGRENDASPLRDDLLERDIKGIIDLIQHLEHQIEETSVWYCKDVGDGMSIRTKYKIGQKVNWYNENTGKHSEGIVVKIKAKIESAGFGSSSYDCSHNSGCSIEYRVCGLECFAEGVDWFGDDRKTRGIFTINSGWVNEYSLMKEQEFISTPSISEG